MNFRIVLLQNDEIILLPHDLKTNNIAVKYFRF